MGVEGRATLRALGHVFARKTEIRQKGGLKNGLRRWMMKYSAVSGAGRPGVTAQEKAAPPSAERP